MEFTLGSIRLMPNLLFNYMHRDLREWAGRQTDSNMNEVIIFITRSKERTKLFQAQKPKLLQKII